MSGTLTTHVLDTSSEGPAAGVSVTAKRVGSSVETIATGTTNEDGRVPEPLLAGEQMEAGTYQLWFAVGDYYREQSTETSFLEDVPVQFVITDPEEHYHVPLLVSPGGYTTYRGS